MSFDNKSGGSGLTRMIAGIGFTVRGQLVALGYAARLLMRLLATAGPAMKRFGLVRDQVPAANLYSYPGYITIRSSIHGITLFLVCLKI